MGVKEHFAGKCVVITGASSGMGWDLALLLASYGAKLGLCARRLGKLEELKPACEELGSPDVQIFEADVVDREAMIAMRDALFAKWGFVDIVVANAGIGGLNPGPHFDMDLNERTMKVNFFGLANTLIPYVPSMIDKATGQLVTISSLSAFRGLPNAGSYCSAKAAQARLSESLRVDLRPKGIDVTCIHPGFIESPMTDHDEFTMPFMVPVRKSSELIAWAIARRKAVYLYPWQMRMLTYLNRMLPPFLFDRIVPAVSGQKKDLKPKSL